MPVEIALDTLAGPRQNQTAPLQPDNQSNNNTVTSDNESLSSTRDSGSSNGNAAEDNSANEPPSLGATAEAPHQDQPALSTSRRKSMKELCRSISGTWIGTAFGLAALVVGIYFGLWSLRLQRWTAAKDFRDQCENWSQNYHTMSPECVAALSDGPSPPPTGYRLAKRFADLDTERPIFHMIYDQAERYGPLLITIVVLVSVNMVVSTFLLQAAQPGWIALFLLSSCGALGLSHLQLSMNSTAFAFAWVRVPLDKDPLFDIFYPVILGVWAALNGAVVFLSTWLPADSSASLAIMGIFTLVGSLYFARAVRIRKDQRKYHLEARELERQMQGAEMAVEEKQKSPQTDTQAGEEKERSEGANLGDSGVDTANARN